MRVHRRRGHCTQRSATPIAIATAPPCAALSGELVRRALDPGATIHDGRLVFADARETLETIVVCDDPAMISVQVRDAGIRIPAAKLDQILDPFVQAGPRPTGKSDGVGLGLAISRELARRIGGDLHAESV